MLNRCWPHGIGVKLGPQHNCHMGWAAIRHYANQPALLGAFSVIVQLRRLIVYSICQQRGQAGGNMEHIMFYIWSISPMNEPSHVHTLATPGLALTGLNTLPKCIL